MRWNSRLRRLKHHILQWLAGGAFVAALPAALLSRSDVYLARLRGVIVGRGHGEVLRARRENELARQRRVFRDYLRPSIEGGGGLRRANGQQ